MSSNKSFDFKQKVIGTVIAVVIIAMLGALAIWSVGEQKREKGRSIEKNKAEWVSTALVSPKPGSLKPSGYITIEWKKADSLGEVKGYELYLDGEMVASLDSKDLAKMEEEETTTQQTFGVSTEEQVDTVKYEIHTSGVKSHEVYIKAYLYDDFYIYSDVFKFYINKKGFCMNKEMAQAVDATKWNVSWYYNWAVNPFKYDSFVDLQFVPMFWSPHGTDDQMMNRLEKWGYNTILTFNEPDLSEQANMTIEEAIEGMRPLTSHGMHVSSPATALCPPWSKTWFQPFWKQMENEGMEMDFIAVHHYWNWYNEEGAQAFLDLIDETWEMYHKPIWITEFAISGAPYKYPGARKGVQSYMKNVIKGLDERDYVERYAWFSFGQNNFKNGGSAMYQQYTGEVTKLGKIYQSMGNPEGYGDSSIKTQWKNENKDKLTSD